jgi:hypothetical protein
MAYFTSERTGRRDPRLGGKVATRAIAREDHGGLAETLFTTLNSAVFLILIAAVAGAAILYAQGT